MMANPVAKLTELQRRTADEEPIVAAPEWPSLAPQALHGPLGDLVRLVEPHTEADPVAILVQALVAFGSVIGRGPHWRAEADEHHGKLFVALVGATAKGRKGTSWGQVRRVFAAVDSEWAEHRVLSGLSSGEGLIWAVRDPILGTERDRKTRQVAEVLVDPGVEDKRLLVVEPELAQAFKVARREGNTLSPLIREAWESGRLRALTKNSPAVATGAHVSIVGHITRDELLRHLGETEAGNGFGNRFLWLLVRRSKCLPEGGTLAQQDLGPLVCELGAAVRHARGLGLLCRDDEARKLWAAVYPALSEGKPGLLGAMIARAEAQVMRLAMLYALADRCEAIRPEHLVAALAVWDYAEASARSIFGEALGDPVADEVLAALRAAPSGLTRSELRDHFGRNRSSEAIGRALASLAVQQLATGTREGTGGRPAERWTLSASTSFTASSVRGDE